MYLFVENVFVLLKIAPTTHTHTRLTSQTTLEELLQSEALQPRFSKDRYRR